MRCFTVACWLLAGCPRNTPDPSVEVARVLLDALETHPATRGGRATGFAFHNPDDDPEWLASFFEPADRAGPRAQLEAIHRDAMDGKRAPVLPASAHEMAIDPGNLMYRGSGNFKFVHIAVPLLSETRAVVWFQIEKPTSAVDYVAVLDRAGGTWKVSAIEEDLRWAQPH